MNVARQWVGLTRSYDKEQPSHLEAVRGNCRTWTVGGGNARRVAWRGS